jgi:hypothetical protein
MTDLTHAQKALNNIDPRTIPKINKVTQDLASKNLVMEYITGNFSIMTLDEMIKVYNYMRKLIKTKRNKNDQV